MFKYTYIFMKIERTKMVEEKKMAVKEKFQYFSKRALPKHSADVAFF